MQSWQARPLDEVYAAVFIGAIVVKVRDGQVANRPVYAAIGVTLAGEKDILGAGRDRRGRRQVLDERADRPAQPRDQGRVLRGLRRPEGPARRGYERLAAGHRADVHRAPDPQHVPADLQRDWDAMKRDVKQIYTAVSADAARAALDELAGKWGKQYRAVIRLWENAWEQFIPFLDYDPEIRTVICSTNAIESLNARYRRAVKARGHFPTEQAAIKCLYLVTGSLTPPGPAGQGGRCGGGPP